MDTKRCGLQSLTFPSRPCILTSASISGPIEGQGPLGTHFDMVLDDDLWGEDTWEHAERKMYERAVRIACDKCDVLPENLGCLLGGDLLNQLISANFAARALKSPYLGLYGACSTMAESLLVGSVLVDGEYAKNVACCACSHFSTAERQYRFPLELGGQTTPSAQHTVTGAGCCILSANDCKNTSLPQTYKHLHTAGATIGKVKDMGITDANNMGAAMAPAAADTLTQLLTDFNEDISAFDLIITGDLGSFGTDLFRELMREANINVDDVHVDCGNMIYFERQKMDCGGSGCGCSAITLSGYLLKRMEAGDFKRAIFMATGALLSPDTTLQGDSIPSIAHAVIIERSE